MPPIHGVADHLLYRSGDLLMQVLPILCEFFALVLLVHRLPLADPACFRPIKTGGIVTRATNKPCQL